MTSPTQKQTTVVEALCMNITAQVMIGHLLHTPALMDVLMEHVSQIHRALMSALFGATQNARVTRNAPVVIMTQIPV